MRILLALTVLLTGCLDDTAGDALDCEQLVCAHVPYCSPLTTGGWEMTSEAACLDTFACGATPDACLDAMLALPCLSEPPTWDELEANTRALKLAREVCAR